MNRLAAAGLALLASFSAVAPALAHDDLSIPPEWRIDYGGSINAHPDARHHAYRYHVIPRTKKALMHRFSQDPDGHLEEVSVFTDERTYIRVLKDAERHIPHPGFSRRVETELYEGAGYGYTREGRFVECDGYTVVFARSADGFHGATLKTIHPAYCQPSDREQELVREPDVYSRRTGERMREFFHDFADEVLERGWVVVPVPGPVWVPR
ncbi:MAG: hypothetical protein ACPGRX_00290 [Bdellovibrionales bacterium]